MSTHDPGDGAPPPPNAARGGPPPPPGAARGGPPPPNAARGGPPPQAKPKNDYHARPLDEVCKTREGVKPLQSYGLEMGTYPGGKKLLTEAEPSGSAPVSEAVCEVLISALGWLGNAREGARSHVNKLTIRQFRELGGHGQIELINEVWELMATPHPFTEDTVKMFEPDALVGDEGPLPSSSCPDPHHPDKIIKRLGVHEKPFTTLGVGFRVDGSQDGKTIPRIRSEGMTQQRLNRDFMRNTKGYVLEGTVMETDAKHARCWTGNHDIINPTALCVSRNFFGATAFPERTTVKKGVLLWAVDVLGLKGFDTEQYQKSQPGKRWWRPGEKAYEIIPWVKVLGYVEIERHGQPDTGGWSFEIDQHATWTFVEKHATDLQRHYMEAELNAWRGKHTIPGTHDFAT
jgi:hypothetical protein